MTEFPYILDEFDETYNLELLKEYSNNRSIELRNKIVENNMRLVNSFATHFMSKYQPNFELADLVQEGYIALMIALDHYDINMNSKFSTYAGFWIRAFMLDYYHDNYGSVEVPKHQFIAYSKVNDKIADYRQANIGSFDRKAIYEYKKTVKHYDLIKNALKPPISLDVAFCGADSSLTTQSSLVDSLADSSASLDDVFSDISLSDALSKVTPPLNDREQEVVYLRFYNDYSYRMIAQALHIPIGTVGRILSNLFDRFRNRDNSHLFDTAREGA